MQQLTQEDILDILEVLEGSKFSRLDLTFGTTRVAVNRDPPGAASFVNPPAALAAIVAPLLGIFQASPEPSAAAFVQVGTQVEADTVVGIIHVMQDRTTVKAGLCGTVVDVVVRDGEFVEYGQTLFDVSIDTAAPRGAGSESDGVNSR